MPEDRYNSRRIFLKTVSAGAAAASLGLGWPTAGAAQPLRSARTSDEVIVGIMGTGGRGLSLARSLTRLPGVVVGAVCDVDARRLEEARAAVAEAQGRAPAAVKDFRRILDDTGVDALVIATPDHWHAPATVLACQAGKHVYVEKPCSHSPREGELLIEAARRYDRVVQMGTQRRSWPGVVEAIQKVRQGAIGPVHYSRGWYANNRGPIGKGRRTEVPAWLDFELWQGPASREPYRDNILHYNWHWFWNWGTGEAGNNGVHALDLCRWGLDVDYPTRVTSAGGRYHYQDDWETPDTQVVTFEFEGGKSVMWEGLSCNRRGIDGSGFGISFHGENGSILIEGRGYTVLDADGKPVEKVSGDARSEARSEAPALTGPGFSGDAVHLNNFLDGIRKGERLHANIEEGHKSSLLCQLGNIALRAGGILRCDPKNGHILDDPAAAALWGRAYAPGWEPKV